MNNFIKLIESLVNFDKGLEFIEKEIELIYKLISQTDTFEETGLMFNNLEDIQIVLAREVFQNKVEVTPFLREFIYDLDRIDEIFIKKGLFEKLRIRS